MNHDAEDLNYLTLDSIQWATGATRPRLTLEDKRAKHRVHQRHFVFRQRKRIEQLQRDLRCHELQLLKLRAFHEEAALQRESELLREKVAYASWAGQPGGLSVTADSSASEPERLPVDTDEDIMFELLTMLPEMPPSESKYANSCRRYEKQDLTPLLWTPTAPYLLWEEPFVW